MDVKFTTEDSRKLEHLRAWFEEHRETRASLHEEYQSRAEMVESLREDLHRHQGNVGDAQNDVDSTYRIYDKLEH